MRGCGNARAELRWPDAGPNRHPSRGRTRLAANGAARRRTRPLSSHGGPIHHHLLPAPARETEHPRSQPHRFHLPGEAPPHPRLLALPARSRAPCPWWSWLPKQAARSSASSKSDFAPTPTVATHPSAGRFVTTCRPATQLAGAARSVRRVHHESRSQQCSFAPRAKRSCPCAMPTCPRPTRVRPFATFIGKRASFESPDQKLVRPRAQRGSE